MNIVSKIERDNYFKSFKDSLKGKKFQNSLIVLCPPAIHLESFLKNIKSKYVSFGVQDAHWENSGAYTGEISCVMAKNCGAEFAIIGHSERRNHFNETDETINKKIISSLKENVMPIMCIGESLAERNFGETKKIILDQILRGLSGVARTKISKMIIAYEPIWAIGTGETPTGEEIMGVRILIQKIMADNFGLSMKQMPKILYGGSVDYKNVKEVCLDAGMDGVLVGGESLHPASFIKIVEILDKNN